MTRKRAHVPLTTKLAACLAELQYLRGDPIPYKQLQDMTAAQLCSLYQWDHSTYACWGGGEHFLNLTPRLILIHREKTKRDRKIIAKADRIAKKHKAELLPIDVRGEMADGGKPERPKKRWPSRPMESRPWPKRQKRGKP